MVLCTEESSRSGVLDPSSGLFCASNDLRTWTRYLLVLWGLGILIWKKKKNKIIRESERAGEQARPYVTDSPSERQRRKHTSNAQQMCQRVKYFGSGDENNSN